MKILSVASEVFPLIKTGGLADVAGALPIALAPLGISMRTVMPGYPVVLDKVGQTIEVSIRGGGLEGAKEILVDGTGLSAKLNALDRAV